jgi:hypothetical protein
MPGNPTSHHRRLKATHTSLPPVLRVHDLIPVHTLWFAYPDMWWRSYAGWPPSHLRRANIATHNHELTVTRREVSNTCCDLVLHIATSLMVA